MIASLPLSYIVANWRPGSADAKGDSDEPWTWDDERADLMERICVCCDRPGHYQAQIVAKMKSEGVYWTVEGAPMLGNDGRVWDGHHRIVGALDLGWETLLVEVVSGDDLVEDT